MEGQETEAWLATVVKTQEKEDVDIDQAIDFNPYDQATDVNSYNTSIEEKKSPSPRIKAQSSQRKNSEEEIEGKSDQPGKFSP